MLAVNFPSRFATDFVDLSNDVCVWDARGDTRGFDRFLLNLIEST
jgi:hypothetical protein